MKTRIITLLAVFAFGAIPASARQAVDREPGAVDLRRFERLFDQEPTLEVNLSGSLLRMVAEAARIDDHGLAELLEDIRAIYVRGYSLSREEADRMKDSVSDLSTELRDAGWLRVVRVREEEDQVDVLSRESDGKIEGLAVLVVSPGSNETVFVNIAGDIRPEEIGRIGRRFSIHALDRF